MDLDYSEEQKMLQQLVRQFVKDELMPLEKVIMSKRYYECGRRYMLGEKIRKELEEKAKDIGLFALYVPEEYGGVGLGWVEFTIITEEIERTLTPFEFGGDAPPVLLENMSDYIRDNYYLPCARGEKSYCFALSEANAGADPAGLQTTATRDGDHWVLNGSKMWCTDGEGSDFALLFAITDKAKHEAKRTDGISMLVVDRKIDSKPGYVPSLIEIISEYCVSELALDEVRVPIGNLIGKGGDGFAVAQKWLGTRGRLHHGARNIGIANRALEMSRDYANQRVTFGQPLATRQAIQWMLADMAIDIHACRCMVKDCAWRADQKQDIREYAAIVKVFSDEMINRVLDKAIQIHGGLGVSSELPLERFYRQARIWKIAGGPMEVMRMLISRSVLRGWTP